MNRNSKLLSIFAAAFAFALMFALAGCGQQASSSAASSSSASASSASASAASATSDSASATSASAASPSASASSAAAANEVTFTLKVDASDADKGILHDGGGTVEKGTTVYQALVDTGLDLTVTSSSGSTYIDGINGVVASETGANAGWLFTVNGETPSVGADALEIADGDNIVWTFYKDYSQAK